MFQFHIGAIRSSTSQRWRSWAGKFQFHIGAIRSWEILNQSGRSHKRFNSILVQLEAWGFPLRIISTHKFQFHIGAIRSRTRAIDSSYTSRFQFHIGAIRRRNPKRRQFTHHLFQFHIGAIRSSKKR